VYDGEKSPKILMHGKELKNFRD